MLASIVDSRKSPISESALVVQVNTVLPVWTIVGISGHRHLSNSKTVADAIHSVLDELAVSHCHLAAVCSTAIGADTLFLEEAATRKLPYFLVFPFVAERFRQDFEPEEWNRVAAYFDGSLDIEVVQNGDTDNDAYLECGVRTVDRCDVLLAVWDGKPAAGKGGTGDIVDYARALKKPLIVIDPATGALQRERIDQLKQCENATSEGATRAGALSSASPREQVSEQYSVLNTKAKEEAPRARQLVQRIIQLHLVAAAIGISELVLGLTGHIEHFFGACELAVLCVAFVLTRSHRRAHQEWLHARAASEICRSVLACWSMQRRNEWLPTPSIEHQDELVGNLRMAWYLDRGAERTLEAARDEYISDRIDHQIEYFHDKYQRAGDRADGLKRAAILFTLAAIVCVLITSGLSLAGHHGTAFTVFKLFAKALPLVPPALLSLVIAHDLSRRSLRFDEVTQQLKDSRERLQAARTWPGLWREVNRCETLLLQEVAEWQSLARFTAEAH